MTHEQIINEVNEKGFYLIPLEGKERGFAGLVGSLAGLKLSRPIAYNDEFMINFEISWELAERIATGQTNEIYF